MLYSNMLKLLIILLVSRGLVSCDQSPQRPIGTTNSSISPLRPANDSITIKKGEVKSGQGLFQALKSISIENVWALKLINQLRDEVEFSKIKVGDKLEATFKNEELIKFSFSQNPVETHTVTYDKKQDKWEYSLETLETFWRPRTLEGELRPDSTLEGDLIAEGLDRSVVNEVVNVLLCKVNFRMNARKGDRYKVLLSEQIFEQRVVGTKVLFTSYEGKRAGKHEAFFYEDQEKGSTYTAHYTENGQALINSGLRYPLSRLHIRSSYGWRTHPVTGRRAMHRGVDLRGRVGEKVHAVAAGKVVISSYNKYAGNKVGIRHKDGSTSYYYHLSKRGVKVGQWVRSHQVIGRVGATGRVTGAHLHFGFKRPNGRWMDPLNKRMIATPKLSGEKFSKLTFQIAMIRGTLADLEMSKQSKYLVARINDLNILPEREDKLAKLTNFITEL
ncbi:hypothetical protein BIY24_08980 [Halobacteriovorax marinus]|nr:hypothetical protein BIY24_08980 [Halobacteriovorax marinus]